MEIKNKKADERLLSIYLFIIYIIVSVGIVSGVLLVFGSVDVRETEASILTDKVIDCLVKQGKLNEIFWRDSFGLEDCNLDFNDKKTREEQYGVKIEVFDFYTNKKLKEAVFGRDDFLKFCSEKGDKIPKCNEKKVYVLGEELEMIDIDYNIDIADPDDVDLGVRISSETSIQDKYLLKVMSAVGKANQNT